MRLRLVPLTVLFGISTALAFDTSKIGQWGSLFLDDLAPLTAKSARLQQEIDEALAQADKKAEEIRCFGMRFPGPWKNLSGLRVSPYACDFGGKYLEIHATVRVSDRRGRAFETITPKAMKNATKVSETNLNWKWTTEDPVTGPPWHVRYAPPHSWCVNKGNAFSPDQQISGCTAAIQSGRWSGQDLAWAFNNRGLAYQDKHDYDRAIADYDEAIRLDPKYDPAFNNRGAAYLAKGGLDRAIADFNEAIRFDPRDSGQYLNRGLANLYSGSLPEALADLNQSSELDPKSAYAALWRDVVERRSNLPSRLAQASMQIDMTKWPAAIIRLYLGQMTPEAVLAAADDPYVNTKKRQVCDANFFIGELALQRGAKDEAVRLFRLAAAGCEKTGGVANIELKALGAQP
jgi:lipoprotein NlpI